MSQSLSQWAVCALVLACGIVASFITPTYAGRADCMISNGVFGVETIGSSISTSTSSSSSSSSLLEMEFSSSLGVGVTYSTVTYYSSNPVQQSLTDWAASQYLKKFDLELGTLAGVYLYISANIQTVYSIQNLGGEVADGSLSTSLYIGMRNPSSVGISPNISLIEISTLIPKTAATFLVDIGGTQLLGPFSSNVTKTRSWSSTSADAAIIFEDFTSAGPDDTTIQLVTSTKVDSYAYLKGGNMKAQQTTTAGSDSYVKYFYTPKANAPTQTPTPTTPTPTTPTPTTPTPTTPTPTTQTPTTQAPTTQAPTTLPPTTPAPTTETPTTPPPTTLPPTTETPTTQPPTLPPTPTPCDCPTTTPTTFAPATATPTTPVPTTTAAPTTSTPTTSAPTTSNFCGVISGGADVECSKFGLTALSKDDFNQPTASMAAQVTLVKGGKCYTVYRNTCAGTKLETYDGKDISHVTYCGAYTCSNAAATLMEMNMAVGKSWLSSHPTTSLSPVKIDVVGTAELAPSSFWVSSPLSGSFGPISSISGHGTPHHFVKIWSPPVYSITEYLGTTIIGASGEWHIELSTPISSAKIIFATEAEAPFETPIHVSETIEIKQNHGNGNGNGNGNALLLQLNSARRHRSTRKNQRHQQQ